MGRRFQFSLKWLFVAMMGPAFFFGGIQFERERFRRAVEAITEEIEETARQIEMKKAQAGTLTPSSSLPAE